MSLRYVLGPQITATRKDLAGPVAPQDGTAPPAPKKLDVLPAFKGVDEVAWSASFGVPAYDLATYSTLAEIRICLVPTGPPFAPLPTTGQGWVDSTGTPFSVEDVAAYQSGVDVVVNLPTVGPGSHLGQIVYGYKD